jgi:aryl-alcohol dehydrogenase-like predicted oxidoreductase
MRGSGHRTLGSSGLVVSQVALGTMTFGATRWGSDETASREIFNAYVDAGGNFIDTADVYSAGRSEEWVGRFIAERQLRDEIVLSTKFTWQSGPRLDVNAGGNGRKNIYRALHASLRRLSTDHIDLYWLHAWDRVTPVEEVLQTMGDLVRAGTIRYFGLSDVPAWYATKAATLASAHATPGPIALQLEYSLAERSIEREHIPAALELGLGITPWSPLAAGFLTGKYARLDAGVGGSGRLLGVNPFGEQKFTARNWRTLEALSTVASACGRPMAQVALAWLLSRPGVNAPILGVSSVEQLHENLAANGLELSAEQLQALGSASVLESAHPYDIFSDTVHRQIFGGRSVQGCNDVRG